jgi:hypothetical protein
MQSKKVTLTPRSKRGTSEKQNETKNKRKATKGRMEEEPRKKKRGNSEEKKGGSRREAAGKAGCDWPASQKR